MKKKNVFIILIIIIVLLCIFASFQFFNQSSQITYGNITFTLPEGFHETTSDSDDKINFTNGYDSMVLSKYDGNDLNEYVNEYIDYKTNENFSVVLSNFTTNNITVYKVSIENNSDTVHYWFSYEGTTYSIYTWDANKNSDQVVFDIIKSLHS